MSEVHSPCRGECSIDRGTGGCRGCRRSIREITDWSTYADEEKRAVLRKRERAEEAKRYTEQVRKNALAKLTDEERQALGLELED